MERYTPIILTLISVLGSIVSAYVAYRLNKRKQTAESRKFEKETEILILEYWKKESRALMRKLEELEAKFEQVQKEKKELEETVKQLQDENARLTERIVELESKLQMAGTYDV